MRALSRTQRAATGLLVCTLGFQACTPDAPPPPRDLSHWNWPGAQDIATIEDELSALHLREDGSLLGLDDDGFLISIASLETEPPGDGWPRRPLDGGGDLEGLCRTDSSDLLVLLEDRGELVRVDAGGQRVASHALDKQIPGGEQGLEGLAWVPTEQGAETLWLGHQGEAKVYVVRAPEGREEPLPLALLGVFDLGDEARGLMFDPNLGAVLAVVDDAQEIWLIELDGTLRDQRPWPDELRDVEGITLGPSGGLLLALDGGGVWRIPPAE